MPKTTTCAAEFATDDETLVCSLPGGHEGNHGDGTHEWAYQPD